MDGLTFTATFSSVSVTTVSRDVFQIVAPTDSRVEICECELGQFSDAGDAQDELLSFEIIRGSTTSGSGGSAVTPAKHQPWSRAAGSSVMVSNTTVASSGGVAVYLKATSFNVRAGMLYKPNESRGVRPASERVYLEAGERCVFRISAPADAVTMNGTLTFKEIGLT